jgi:shikimate dehydrogenase
MTDRYAVVGNPIAHSKSPFIHARFAEQTGQDIRYEALLAPLDGFAETVRGFFAAGGKGLNVTVPFKLEAYELVDRLGGWAERAGAVNTIALEPDGTLLGENTDGIGLERDLTANLQVRIEDRRLLVLGAGGAVRGILEPLLRSEPRELVVANRTVARAELLRDLFSDLGPVQACGFDALAGRRFDVVVNGTSASLAGDLPPLPAGLFATDAVAYDLFYAPQPTAFMRWALEQGAGRAFDGLGMLVEQAAESFFIWRGVRPETIPVIGELRKALKQGT